jgi:hypothetical protein
MSKNSHKSRYEQLMQWLPTLSSKRNKPVKAKVTQQPNYSKANAYRS